MPFSDGSGGGACSDRSDRSDESDGVIDGCFVREWLVA